MALALVLTKTQSTQVNQKENSLYSTAQLKPCIPSSYTADWNRLMFYYINRLSFYLLVCQRNFQTFTSCWKFYLLLAYTCHILLCWTTINGVDWWPAKTFWEWKRCFTQLYTGKSCFTKFLFQKYTIWVWKSPTLEELTGTKLKFKAHMHISCQKFAAVWQKIATPCPQPF